MKAWSRAQHAQEREAGLYAHHQAEAELISSYLNSQQAVEAAVAAVSSSREPYGVPIPPPLLPHEHPEPPQRSSSSSQQRSRGKRSRHAGTTASNSRQQAASASAATASGDIHYPKYDLYGYKYNNPVEQCQYTTKYGEDCHYKYNSAASSAAATAGSASTGGCAYNKTWPKQHCTDEEGRVYTQDDHQVQYVDQYGLQQQQQPPRSKKTRKQQQHRDRSPGQVNPDFPCFSSREREYLVSTGHYQAKASDPIPAIEEVGRYIEQAESRAKSVKDIARDLAKDRAALCATEDNLQGQQDHQEQQPPEAPPPPPTTMETSQTSTNLQTFNPQASTKAEVQLSQQEHIQYVENECCKEAAMAEGQQHAQQQAGAATLPRRAVTGHPVNKSKTGTLSTAQMNAQFGTLERNMAEVAERNRQSRAELGQSQTLDRSRSAFAQSCDTCDAPLTPASLAGIDHRDLEHRPLTRSVTRATVYDEPPEK